MTRTPHGPDLVIAGAARSGTSLLAAHLSAHPDIDASAVKEPNFFSRRFDEGAEWYESYFGERRSGLLRLDASVSYTYPQHPESLQRLADFAPGVRAVYVVRDPIPRAISHYQLNRYYFQNDPAADLGAALRADWFYADVSNYERWLTALSTTLGTAEVLVVPFEELKSSPHDVAAQVCQWAGLTPPPASADADSHRNSVVAFRSEGARRATRRLRHSRAYPHVRRILGPTTLRRIRSAVTKDPDLPTRVESLASLDEDQRERLEAMAGQAKAAVGDWLVAQDARLGMQWAASWDE